MHSAACCRQGTLSLGISHLCSPARLPSTLPAFHPPSPAGRSARRASPRCWPVKAWPTTASPRLRYASTLTAEVLTACRARKEAAEATEERQQRITAWLAAEQLPAFYSYSVSAARRFVSGDCSEAEAQVGVGTCMQLRRTSLSSGGGAWALALHHASCSSPSASSPALPCSNSCCPLL